MGGQNTESPGGCKAFGESGLTPVKRRDINEMVEPILVRVLDQLMTWRWTGVNKRHSDASQQTIRLRSRIKVLLIRRKNQRVSVSYVRVLFVVSQENSVFTLCLFKCGGFFMSTYLEHRNTPTLCRAGARYFYLIHIYRESVHFIFKFSKDSVRVSFLIRGH